MERHEAAYMVYWLTAVLAAAMPECLPAVLPWLWVVVARHLIAGQETADDRTSRLLGETTQSLFH